MTGPLSSTRNPRVRAAATLTRRRERRDRGLHLVEGPRAVREALAAGVVVEVFATADGLAGLGLSTPPRSSVAVVEVAEHVLDHLADTASPQGVVAVATTPTARLDEVEVTGFAVVLDQLADPGNVGTTIRTADAAGADAVLVLAGGADPFGPKAVRAAVGSTYHLPVVTDVTLDDVLAWAAARGVTTFGLDAAGTRMVSSLTGDDLPLALVLGSEAHGLSAADRLDATLSVPIHGRAESLNAAAAAAIAAYAVADVVVAARQAGVRSVPGAGR